MSILSSRYASNEMNAIFSPYKRHHTWRKLWIALAKAEKKLGLSITDSQIAELEKHLDAIDFEKADAYEKKFKHDVMAHIHAYGDLCPTAKSIIHLGATSCYVTDNADVLLFKEALELILAKLTLVLKQLKSFALKYAAIPCVGYTHFQLAQPTTVGKRASLWLQDLLMDAELLTSTISGLKLLGAKGATGTAASFYALFNNDGLKVAQLEQMIAQEFRMEKVFAISGQTYTRKQDCLILNALSGFAISSHKMANDLRLLAHTKEIREHFGSDQVGSSAMPYKQNPILSERVCGIARYLISLNENTSYTAATQWLERSLDDSSNRRIVMPDAFLSADSLLNLLIKLTSSLSINPRVIESHLQEALPFLATENILMEAVKKGGDRQKLHEKLRVYSLNIEEMPLLEKIAQDPDFGLNILELKSLLDPRLYIGMASIQVSSFIQDELDPFLEKSISYEQIISAPDI